MDIIKKIAIKGSNGDVAIMDVYSLSRKTLEKQINDFEKVWIDDNENFIKIVSYEEITENCLPDRYFRKAWYLEGQSVKILMDKAKTVHMDNIRKVRDEKLKQLDIETLKGIDVQPQKKVLRDLPKTFDLSAARTPEELKALWPDELK